MLVGESATAAAAGLAGVATELRVWDTPGYAPAAWAVALAPELAAEDVIVLAASPDGRDLAPRLAARLERPLYAAAMELRVDDAPGADPATGTVTTVRHGGRVLAEHQLAGAAVVTLQPGVRGVDRSDHELPAVVRLDLDAAASGAEVVDVELVELLPPDVSTMDLSEAPRILGGGAGLDGAARFDQLERVAAALDGSMGATRVITDRSWVGHARQIGTTGVVVDPRLYLAFGISGAVQHTAGLGDPDHIVSVNTEQHCPMMELADLAVVADANATLDELARLLEVAGDD